MKSAADVKRAMVVGTNVVVERSRDGEVVYKDVTPRVVVHVQSNAFCLAANADAKRADWSWCDWPKASELSFPVADSFKVERKGMALLFKVVAS